MVEMEEDAYSDDFDGGRSEGRLEYDPAAAAPSSDGGSLLGGCNLLVEKRARQLAEDDAHKLYNRIRQLQKEEEKAQRRIEETQRKAQEVSSLRERNEARQAERQHRQQDLAARVEQQRRQNLRAKEINVRNRVASECKVLAERAEAAQQTKEETLEIQRAIGELRELHRARAQEKKDAVLRMHAEGGCKLQQFRAAKLNMGQEEYERRLREEMDMKAQKEQEIARLTQLEAEALERLRQKQQEQQRANEQLEALLTAGMPARSTKQRRTPRTPGSQHSVRQSHERSPRMPAHDPSSNGTDAGTAEPAAAGDMSDEDIARVFSNYDPHGIGEIGVDNIGGLMSDLGTPLEAPQLQMAVQQLDEKGSGVITFGEFLMWWRG